MAYINYDIENNYYEVIKGYYNKENNFNEEKINQEISLLKEDGSIKGIKFNNVFNNLELKGARAEIFIKNFLEKNHIPFLYIGQGSVGVEYSNVLKNDLEAHRPDFLIHLPDIGTIFFDVKCRTLRSFNEKDEKGLFYLFKNELETLINLNNALFIPVWIAFINANSKESFFIISVSQLKKYYESLKKNISEKELNKLSLIRIPFEILHEIKNKLELPIGFTSINEKIVSNLVEKTCGLIRRIEDEIKYFIRNNNINKTNLPSQLLLKNDKLKFISDFEIKNILKSLIEEGIIIYENKRPLRLKGE